MPVKLDGYQLTWLGLRRSHRVTSEQTPMKVRKWLFGNLQEKRSKQKNHYRQTRWDGSRLALFEELQRWSHR